MKIKNKYMIVVGFYLLIITIWLWITWILRILIIMKPIKIITIINFAMPNNNKINKYKLGI